MNVIYSIGAKFAGGGIGNTAFHAVSGLYRHKLLDRLLCGSYIQTEIPHQKIKSLGLISIGLRKAAIYDKKRRINYWHNLIYDQWAMRQLKICHVFHGWGGFCLNSLRKAKQLGAITIVERASAHSVLQHKILYEEYEKWGHTFQSPKESLKRSVAEFELADYILVPSEFVFSSFINEGFQPNNLIKLPFGVDTDKFTTAGKKDTQIFRVLFVGQISMQKGVIYLLEAWKALNWKSAELLMVGRIEPDTEAIIAPYKKLPGIHWLGHVKDPVTIYQEADIFVFPSLHEGSALVTYEAMACGLPVITTPNAGSLVRNGQDGIIVPIRQAEQLARAMEVLRNNDAQRHQMGQSARNQIESYTWKKYGDKLATIVKSLNSSCDSQNGIVTGLV